MDKEKLEIMRHSAAHVLAAAVLELYPTAKFGVGPVVENGFYYDFELGKNLTTADLPKIESKMREIIKRNLPFERQEMSCDEAIKLFEQFKQPYKLELLREGTVGVEGKMESLGERVTIYKTGKFTDLCRGPHVATAKAIGAFKLTTVAGAYWRGDENKPMLQRIYGVAFETPKELEEYLKMREETEKRDHRKLGKDLQIFTFSDLVGPGLPLWLPNGAIVIEELEKLAKTTEEEAGYKEVRTPHLAKEEMYLTSGHLPYYADSMFPPMIMMEESGKKSKYYLKAMNCPHHHQIFAAEPRSYRDLPLRLSEYGTCYRYEKSGELFGLMRVRMLSMNDAHIYCIEEQFADEFMGVIKLYLKYFKIFGIKKYVMRLSLHSKEGLGKKYIDNPKLWQKTEEMVREVMKKGKVPFVEAADEAAFYGPKIDVQIWSAIGREFTLATNQVDFAVPERFHLTYKDADGKDKTPICIHRAPLSTHERMIGFLLEHYAGAFPTWLAPVQVAVIPVGKRHVKPAFKLAKMLREEGIRVQVEDANETVGYKIRKAEKQKAPYMLVVGDKEMGGKKLNVRVRGKQKTVAMTVKKFIEKIKTEIEKRK
ncbi:threonine--tRNA ligase [Candidatus Falkowbacteria bacterium]|nr:threonine--tRNA ligase [Candidatus Falkowbacteria bacterium]